MWVSIIPPRARGNSSDTPNNSPKYSQYEPHMPQTVTCSDHSKTKFKPYAQSHLKVPCATRGFQQPAFHMQGCSETKCAGRMSTLGTFVVLIYLCTREEHQHLSTRWTSTCNPFTKTPARLRHKRTTTTMKPNQNASCHHFRLLLPHSSPP